MLFNSLVFLVFFPVVYALYRLTAHAGQNRVLLVASYIFYGWWDWRFLALMVGSTVVDWALGLAVERRGPGTPAARRLVWVSVAINLGVLGVFKYLGFFTRELDHLLAAFGLPLLPVLELVLPVGLSFYTFQSIAYVVDIYRGETPALRRLQDFALFIAYFPHLVAGPIQRTAVLIPQLIQPRVVTTAMLASGANLILWGYYKKVFIADNLAVIVDSVFDSPEPARLPMVILAGYAFTWQIYCDFSGYSDIALGISRWMGIELVQNFRLPFFANGPQDLWRRWHISLSTWLRDYLYVPLGGNRLGSSRTGFNLMATMVLGGLWHGANWTFILWGFWHGLGLAVQRMVPRWPEAGLGRFFAVIATFHFTALGFFLFRAPSVGRALELVQEGLAHNRYSPDTLAYARQFVLLVGPLLLVEWAMHRRGDDLSWPQRWPAWVQVGVAALMIGLIFVAGANYAHQFIYFQF